MKKVPILFAFVAILGVGIAQASALRGPAAADSVRCWSNSSEGPLESSLESSSAAAAAAPVDDGRGTPYVVDKSDNICGLDQPRQLTDPARVDYDVLLSATPEVKKIEKDKIDPKSSEGITLMTKARARVLKACESVRASAGHCSVWKDIKRRDKKAVSDITDSVKRLL